MLWGLGLIATSSCSVVCVIVIHPCLRIIDNDVIVNVKLVMNIYDANLNTRPPGPYRWIITFNSLGSDNLLRYDTLNINELVNLASIVISVVWDYVVIVVVVLFRFITLSWDGWLLRCEWVLAILSWESCWNNTSIVY